MAEPTKVHLVGSVPFESSAEVFSRLLEALPNRLRRIPDGETGTRRYFVQWQSFVFPPEVLGPLHRKGRPLESSDFDCTLDYIKPTKYDKVAIESYNTFRKLRDEGVVPRGVRFQVSIPTPINTVWAHVDHVYRERIESLYMNRLIEDLQHLQDVIPACDLAIQIDAAIDFAFLEHEKGRIPGPLFKPHFSPVKDGVIERICKLAEAINDDVQLGFHLCYGDRGHQHFVQPEDAGLLVEVASRLSQEVSHRRQIDWIHMPVPKDRLDEAYYAPLKRLDIGDTERFLGLVHAHDAQATRERLRIAQSMYSGAIGVSTECGLGRTPAEDIDSILTIARTVTAEEISM